MHVGVGVLRQLADELSGPARTGLVVLVSDATVAPLHAEPLRAALLGRGVRAELLVFPAGERSKTRSTKAELEDRMGEIGAGRDATVVAVGGGVTGDLAGFLAATWMRGIDLVQVPTSVTAMVDAAVGGKTAVDLPAGKNLVGAIHQPRSVWADLDTLHTLPREERRAGLAEAVKTGVIADRALLGQLERSAAALVAESVDTGLMQHVVARCLVLKGSIVRRDEREAGLRERLNFGHTLGHALERLSGYAWTHGRAVAIGMALEARLAQRLTGFPAAHTARLRALLQALGLPADLPPDTDPAALVAATRTDKKTRAGAVRYALPARIGGFPAGRPAAVAAPDEEVLAALRG